MPSTPNDHELDDAERWSPATREAMAHFRSRWRRTVEDDNAQDMGDMLTDLWDRLVMGADEPELRRGLAAVGAKLLGDMQLSRMLAMEALPDVLHALGQLLAQIRDGTRTTVTISKASGTTRLITFEDGVRTMTDPSGSPPLLN